ncbi:MAG: lactate utilization protein [Magnetospirillum sp.]|nr:lactate utilization protein [Magnetospirillum sp.]
MAYDRPVEELKPVLVHGVDAGLTTTLGGIAETGTLVLWPTPDEPRLLSLLPPIHIALVRAAEVVDNLAGLIRDKGWAGSMPTNAVLISGPSKTADIEQTLAYGVHGPKELIVLVVKD